MQKKRKFKKTCKNLIKLQKKLYNKTASSTSLCINYDLSTVYTNRPRNDGTWGFSS